MVDKGGAVAGFAIVLLIALAVVTSGCAGTAQDGDNGGDPLYSLTLERKVGQLLIVGFEGTAVTPEVERLFATLHPGGVILFGRNITDEEQLKKLTGDLQELAGADSDLPLFIAIDQEGGQVVRAGWLDDSVSQAQVAAPGQAYELGLARAQALKELGVNLNLAPILDLGVQGDFLTRYGRTFTGSPQEVGELGKNAVSGQTEGGILSAVKHFPGYGGITYDPENEKLAVVSSVPEFSQFQAAAAAGPDFVMTANVIYSELDPELPFTLSPSGIAFLKDNVGGDYLVMSDDLASKVLKEAYGLGTTVVHAARAGVDVLLISGHEAGDAQAAFTALVEAVRGGDIAEEDIDERVTAVMRLKERLSAHK